MARIALVDASEGTALAVRAALGAGAVETCRRGAVPTGARLVILEAAPGPVCDGDGLGSPDVPVLVLVDRALHPVVELEPRRFLILEKPFNTNVLRENIRALFEPGDVYSGNEPRAGERRDPQDKRPRIESPWLAEPWVEASVARVLGGAQRVDGAVWIVGEPGTGTDLAAAALSVGWDPGRDPVVWQESDPLSVAAAGLLDAERVLWAPAVDERALGDQRALERLLALHPARRVVVTSGDDPERAVAAATLSETLAARLSRISVRLAPLRERRRDVIAFAVSLGSDIARRCGSADRVQLTDKAKRAFEAYAWPGNTVELEALLTRSVLAKSAAEPRAGERRDRPILELDLDDLLFAPSHLAPLFAEETSAPRRAVVVALGDAAAARAASAASASATEEPESKTTSRTAEALHEDTGIEAVLAGFAHDIRNPMSTIKTFAGLEASRAGSETAELAGLAVEACERVDEQLELLQRYSEIGASSAAALDLVEVVGEAAESAGAEDVLLIAARRALPVRADAALARFAADAIVAECRARRSPGPDADTAQADVAASPAAGMSALEITIPTGGAAVDRLDKWVAGSRLPWRLALARDAVRRAGGALDVDVEAGQLRLTWRLPQFVAEVVGEEGSVKDHDDQAGSPDRRRRSRGS